MEKGQTPTAISSFTQILDQYDVFIFDCDGVLWNGEHRLDRAFTTLNILKEKNKSVFFITNNSTKSRKKYSHKIEDFGYKANIDDIYPSSFVASAYIKLHYPDIKRIYVVGMEGLVEEATEAGFQVVGGPADNGKQMNEKEFLELQTTEQGIDAVLAGLDMNFNYYKLAYASTCIQKGALFFATNSDPFLRVGSLYMPGAGTMLGAIERATQKMPIVMGKPNTYSIDTIIELHKLDKKKCVVIGDRIDTDILIGKTAGVDTCLVLTGVYNKEMLDAELGKVDPIVPTYVCEAVCVEEGSTAE